MRTVRIQRKGNSFPRQLSGLAGLIALFLNVFFVRPQKEANFTAMEEARYQAYLMRARAEEMRAVKTSNEVVLQDMKIEEQKMKLKLLQHELDVRGLGKANFQAENYSSDRQVQP